MTEHTFDASSATQSAIPPGCIELGAGHPGPDLLPHALMQEAAAHRFATQETSFLQYGVEAGAPALRAQLARFLGSHYTTPAQRVSVSAESLFISNGISQALAMLCTLFTQPGDTVLVEEPTYFLALRIFADHKLRVLPVPMDADGMRMDALEELLQHTQPRMLYTIPAHQNPSGVTLAEARRARLVELAHAHDFLLVADEVYHLLTFRDNSQPDAAPMPPPLAHWSDQPNVISLGSFSKILAPGLRLGWVQAHPARLQTLINSGMLDSGGGLNPFTGALVQSALERDLLAPWVANLCATYARRSRVLASALRDELGDVATFSQPAGGYFIWLNLPEVDSARLQQAAQQVNVGYRAGSLFSLTSAGDSCLRVCFAYYAEAELVEGAQRLARAIRQAS